MGSELFPEFGRSRFVSLYYLPTSRYLTSLFVAVLIPVGRAGRGLCTVAWAPLVTGGPVGAYSDIERRSKW